MFPFTRTGGRLYCRTPPPPPAPHVHMLLGFYSNFSFSYCHITSPLIQNYELRGEKKNIIPYHLAWGGQGGFHIKFNPNQHKDEQIRMSRRRIKVRGVLEESLGCSFLELDDGGKAIVRPEGEERVPSSSLVLHLLPCRDETVTQRHALFHGKPQKTLNGRIPFCFSPVGRNLI